MIAAVATLRAVVTFPGPDSRLYELRTWSKLGAARYATFMTGPEPDGRSADEVAVGNLAATSQRHAGVFELVYLAARNVVDVGPREQVLAIAEDGVARLLVPQDDVAADAMHCGPTLSRLRRTGATLGAVRASLDEPTHWGAA